MITHVLIALGIAIGASWVFAVMALLVLRKRGGPSADLIRTIPDTLGLLGRLARDRDISWRVRWRLVAAVAYSAQPFNLIPDWIPVIGYADNVVVMAWALRSAIRAGGPEAVQRHWRGDADGLALLYRLLRLPTPVPEIPV